MNYDLDASVAVCWVRRRTLSPKALRLRDEYRQSVHQLLAPSVFSDEAASALTKSERQKLIPVGQARLLLDDILRTTSLLYPYEPHLYRATDISSQTRSGVLDCLYVALAEQEGCELVTADDKLFRNLQAQFPFVIALASLP